MKSIIIKIIFVISIVVSINACHTFEHDNIFLENIKRNSHQQILDRSNNNKKSVDNKIDNKEYKRDSEMAPIDIPKKTEKVQKLTLQKRVKISSFNNFSLDKFKNWNEKKLIKKLGKSNFTKEEGKLKNYQYHFKECFLDVFLLKKKGIYIVNYLETRPTQFNGIINKNACLKEIKKFLN